MFGFHMRVTPNRRHGSGPPRWILHLEHDRLTNTAFSYLGCIREDDARPGEPDVECFSASRDKNSVAFATCGEARVCGGCYGRVRPKPHWATALHCGGVKPSFCHSPSQCSLATDE